MSALPTIDVNLATREQLIAHIDELEFRLGELTPPASGILNLRQSFGMTRQVALLVAALSSGRVGTRETLCAAIAEWNDDIFVRSVDVSVFKARRCLQPFGISIRNIFGVGYVMDAADAARVRAVMKGEPA